jgi:hypothetical protein
VFLRLAFVCFRLKGRLRKTVSPRLARVPPTYIAPADAAVLLGMSPLAEHGRRREGHAGSRRASAESSSSSAWRPLLFKLLSSFPFGRSAKGRSPTPAPSSVSVEGCWPIASCTTTISDHALCRMARKVGWASWQLSRLLVFNPSELESAEGGDCRQGHCESFEVGQIVSRFQGEPGRRPSGTPLAKTALAAP